MNSASLLLLQNAAEDSAPGSWPGGSCVFFINGTFGGATATLEYLGPDGVTWFAMAEATDTSQQTTFLPNGSVRVTFAGGTPSGIWAFLASVPLV